MSEDISNKAKQCKVYHEFSGKSHFYKVESPSGETYEVMVKVNCGCEFMGKQGQANGDICSHIAAVFREIGKQGTSKVIKNVE